jgi:hypothetical protein
MSKSYPFDDNIMLSDEQVRQRDIKFELYRYYGIEYDRINDSADGEGIRTKKDKDRDLAHYLIMKGETIPDDLAARLLKYKEQEYKLTKGKSYK